MLSSKRVGENTTPESLIFAFRELGDYLLNL